MIIWLWINTYENTIFSGMNIHKSQLFWCELQGYKVLTHCHIGVSGNEKNMYPEIQRLLIIICEFPSSNGYVGGIFTPLLDTPYAIPGRSRRPLHFDEEHGPVQKTREICPFGVLDDFDKVPKMWKFCWFLMRDERHNNRWSIWKSKPTGLNHLPPRKVFWSVSTGNETSASANLLLRTAIEICKGYKWI